jgi:hypothetical protein
MMEGTLKAEEARVLVNQLKPPPAMDKIPYMELEELVWKAAALPPQATQRWGPTQHGWHSGAAIRTPTGHTISPRSFNEKHSVTWAPASTVSASGASHTVKGILSLVRDNLRHRAMQLADRVPLHRRFSAFDPTSNGFVYLQDMLTVLEGLGVEVHPADIQALKMYVVEFSCYAIAHFHLSGSLADRTTTGLIISCFARLCTILPLQAQLRSNWAISCPIH